MPNQINDIIEINSIIKPGLELTGEISSLIQINGEINNDISEITGSIFSDPVIEVNNLEIPKVISGKIYEGAYVVIPSTTEQTLDTNKKVLTDDIVIEEIPTFWTQNQTGMTFIIGN